MATADMFPGPSIEDVTTEAKIAELNRELNMRRQLYPKWVATGKIDRRVAHSQIIILEAILADYEAQHGKS